MAHAPFDVILLPGIRQDVDPLVAPKGTLADAANVRFGRVGGVYPRNGTETIAPTDNGSGAIQNLSENIGLVGKIGDAGIIGGAGTAWSFDATGRRFNNMGRIPAYRPIGQAPSKYPTGAVPGSSRYGTAVSSAGYVLACGTLTTTTVQFSLRSADGTVLMQDFVSATGGKSAAIGVGASMVMVAQSGTTLTGYVFTLASGVPSVATGTVGTLTSSSAYWDITPASDGTQWYLVHQNGATTLRVDRFSGTTSNANLSQTVAGTCPCSLHADSSAVWLGWHNDPTVTGEVNYRTATTNLSGFATSAVTIATSTTFGPPLIGTHSTGTTKIALFRRSLSAVSPYTVGTVRTRINSTAVVSAARSYYHAVPISKPLAGRAWVATGSQAPGWTSERAMLVNFTADLDLVYPDGEHPSIELAGPQTVKHSVASEAHYTQPDYFCEIASGPSSYYFAVPQILANNDGALADVFSLPIYEYVSTAQKPHRSWLELTGHGLVTSGQPHQLFSEGAAFLGPTTPTDNTITGPCEVGFAHPPYILATAQSVAAGSLTALGSYSYVALFEFQDDLQQRHRSAVATPVAVTLTGSNNTVTVTVAMLGFTQRNGYRVLVYRTVSGGTTYYLDSSSVLGASTGVQNIASTASDVAISDNEIVYTDGGAKDNALAPSCIFSCKSETRIILGGLWARNIIQVSKLMVPGEPAQFVDDPTFQIRVPDDCTGLAYQDGTIVAFCANAIYTITGEGPNDQGIGQFSDARAICRDIGCEDYRSILETAQGILFKSKRGFYLLPRGNGIPVFVGAAVQRLTDPNGDAYSTVLGAVTVSDSRYRTAQFLVQQSDGDTIRLVYDLDIAANDPLNGWSYDTFANDLVAIGPWPNGVLLAMANLSSATQMGYYDECDSTFTVDGSNAETIVSTVQTTQIRVGGLAGEFRCLTAQALLSNADGGALTVGLLLDDLAAETGGSPWTLSATTGSIYRQVSAGQVADVSSFAVRMSVDRMATPGVYYRGPTFHGFTADVDADGDIRRTDSTER